MSLELVDNSDDLNRLIIVTKLIIRIVNNHYYDLQMFANYVIDIDNKPDKISKKNNIDTQVDKISKSYSSSEILFSKRNTELLTILIFKIVLRTGRMHIAPIYNNPDFFSFGSVSTSVLFKQDNMIIKVYPCKLMHHYKYLNFNLDIHKKYETPMYALFYKEAWMYFFCKSIISIYTPAFDCIINCGTTAGFPIIITKKIIDDYYDEVKKTNIRKKWFEHLINNNDTHMNNAIFACFEMKQIEDTLSELNKNFLLTKKDIKKVKKNTLFDNEMKKLQKDLEKYKIDLSFFFEFMYTKLILAYIGKIILTDDHFDNLGYITVNFYRHYCIISKNKKYDFYMPPGKMIQFIDYERYIFNCSTYDYYTNDMLKKMIDDDDGFWSAYKSNIYIYDKGIHSFADPRILNPKIYINNTEYEIMINILVDESIYDIHKFCKIMYKNLPNKYKNKPDKKTLTKHYKINLDDNNIRSIDNDIISQSMS